MSFKFNPFTGNLDLVGAGADLNSITLQFAYNNSVAASDDPILELHGTALSIRSGSRYDYDDVFVLEDAGGYEFLKISPRSIAKNFPSDEFLIGPFDVIAYDVNFRSKNTNSHFLEINSIDIQFIDSANNSAFNFAHVSWSSHFDPDPNENNSFGYGNVLTNRTVGAVIEHTAFFCLPVNDTSTITSLTGAMFDLDMTNGEIRDFTGIQFRGGAKGSSSAQHNTVGIYMDEDFISKDSSTLNFSRTIWTISDAIAEHKGNLFIGNNITGDAQDFEIGLGVFKQIYQSDEQSSYGIYNDLEAFNESATLYSTNGFFTRLLLKNSESHYPFANTGNGFLSVIEGGAEALNLTSLNVGALADNATVTGTLVGLKAYASASIDSNVQTSYALEAQSAIANYVHTGANIAAGLVIRNSIVANGGAENYPFGIFGEFTGNYIFEGQIVLNNEQDVRWKSSNDYNGDYVSWRAPSGLAQTCEYTWPEDYGTSDSNNIPVLEQGNTSFPPVATRWLTLIENFAEDLCEGVVWDTGTPPSDLAISFNRAQRVGTIVFFEAYELYDVAGANNTEMTFDLDSDWPEPYFGAGGVQDDTYPMAITGGFIFDVQNLSMPNDSRCWLGKNADGRWVFKIKADSNINAVGFSIRGHYNISAISRYNP